MQQRQSSCLNCRTRKIKCDRKDPCTRCVKNNNSSCVYPRQGTLGRPPKNAVFHGKGKTMGVHKMAIREFIFEHCNDLNSNSNSNNSITLRSSKGSTKKAHGFYTDSEWWILSKEAVQEHLYLNTYFQTIYWFYVKRGLAIRERFDTVTYRLPEKPRLKFNNLQLLFTWWVSMSANLLIKRASKLQLETYSVPSLTLYMFQMNDNYSNTPQQANKESIPATATYPAFVEPSIAAPLPPYVLTTATTSPSIPLLSPKHHHDSQSNPLRSLPPEQAINLINDFFRVHPHSILINKAKLMKDYWADTANPLLLSVIYGTTQCFAQILQGIPVLLWESDSETNRNPFLAYAHSLLETIPTAPSVTTYQSTVILALFEVVWGYPKLGMSLLATSYLMGTQLGLWDKSFRAADPVEDELVNMTFWSVFRATTHGCIEMGSSIVDSLVYHQLRFPPMNIHESESYQCDALHDNINEIHRHAYLVESFYSGSIVTHFSGILYACLPKPYVNVYGIKTDDSTFEGSELLSMLRTIDDVETRVHRVLDDFAQFIQEHRHKWSVIQLYTIETTYRLYRIHFRFLQPTHTCGQRKYQEDLIPAAPTSLDTAPEHTQHQEDNRDDHYSFMLDPSDPGTVIRLQQSRDDLVALVDDLEAILKPDDDSNTTLKSMDRTTLLPHGLMMAAFETSAQLLMLSYQLDSCQHMYDAMTKLLDVGILQDNFQASSPAMKNVRQRLKIFMKQHQTPATPWNRKHPSTSTATADNHPLPSQQLYDADNNLFDIYSNTEIPKLFFLQPVEGIQPHHQQQQHLAASISTSFSLPSSSPHSAISYFETPLASSPITSSLSTSSTSSHGFHSTTTGNTTMDPSLVQSQQQTTLYPPPLSQTQLLHPPHEDTWLQASTQCQPWDDSSLIDWDSMVVQELPSYELLSLLNQEHSFFGPMPF